MKKDFPEIAVVMYNNLPARCHEVEQNLCDFTKFKINGQHNLHTYETKNITEMLTTLSATHRWAVVIAAGNILQSQKLIMDSVEYAKKENSPLSCHILDRGGYFHLHPQYFTIDLEVYQSLGFPAFEETPGPVDINTKITERSIDNVHDDYTPWWLHSGTETKTYASDQGYFGINVVAGMINAGYNIVNIPRELRQRKNYCYPEHQLLEIKKMIADPLYVPVNNNGPIWWFAHDLRMITQGLDKGYYVMNTEPLYLDNPKLNDQQFDCFVGVASGVKPACLIGKLKFSDDSRIILVDISPAALKWQKHLLESWDGDFRTFEAVFRVFEKQNPDLIPIYFRDQSFENLFVWFFENVQMDSIEFQQCWKRYQTMQVEFVELNLLETPSMQYVVDTINQHQHGAYVWSSNLFHMDYLSFYRTDRWARDKLLEFVGKLRQETKIPVASEFLCFLEFYNC